MVNTSPPEQETEVPNSHIPTEMLEQILSNLSIKSLLQFSSVATSWKSTITSRQFVAKYGGGRKILMINENPCYFDVRDAFCSPLSTIADHPVGYATSSTLVCPFWADVKLKALAFCDELWCVVAKKSMYLWNPSTGACRKLPHSPSLHTDSRWSKPAVNNKVVYGLGYDAIDDDYKLLKIWRSGDYVIENKSFMYSLKDDSWREIPSHFPGDFPNSNGLFVDGALNWMVIEQRRNWMQLPRYSYFSTLISFDFSTEKFRVLQQPPYLPELNLEKDVVDVAVLSGKLCVFVNYMRSYEDTAFVLWAMEDYGVVESWTKLYEIRYKSIPPIVSEFRSGTRFTLRPLYLYEDGRVVIWACGSYKKWDIIVYKGRKIVAHSKIVAPQGNNTIPAKGSPRSRVCGGFVYIESPVSPTTWCQLSFD